MSEEHLLIKEDLRTRAGSVLAELTAMIHRTAKEKGWHNSPRSALEIHALIHCEISEATECVRQRTPHFCYLGTHKPEGEATELVDAVIRILDYFGMKGWELWPVLCAKMEYNATRSHRHGNKAY